MSAAFRKFFPQAVASSAPSADLRRITLEADPTSERATALRSIAQDMLFATKSTKCLVIVPGQSGNISWLTANLAYALAETQSTICLVDANLRRPRLSSVFGLPSTVLGLANVLDSTSSLDAVEYKINPYLTIIPGGEVGGDVVKLISSPKLGEVTTTLASKYSLTIVLCPPAPDFLDYTFIARACNGAILVAQKDKCKMADITHTRDQLIRIEVPLTYVLLSNN